MDTGTVPPCPFQIQTPCSSNPPLPSLAPTLCEMKPGKRLEAARELCPPRTVPPRVPTWSLPLGSASGVAGTHPPAGHLHSPSSPSFHQISPTTLQAGSLSPHFTEEEAEACRERCQQGWHSQTSGFKMEAASRQEKANKFYLEFRFLGVLSRHKQAQVGWAEMT